jgi:dTDP-4-dehydrorhamnose reductase
MGARDGRRVLVLGGSGMLGSLVADVFGRERDLRVTASVRSAELVEACAAAVPEVAWCRFEPIDVESFRFADFDWVVNAIGITKPLIRDDDAGERERALIVNALLPHRLAARARASGARLLQIATDCVFSGARGAYVESDPHDALDVYGKSKSLGEVPGEGAFHLRCSIIGPEPKEHKFLLDWLRGQPRGASLRGFANHAWNGITTLHFAKLCLAIVRGEVAPRPLQHVVPSGSISKYELLECLAARFGRRDLVIERVEVPVPLDRTLASRDERANGALWQAAGYAAPPSVPAMIEELAAFSPRLAGLDAKVARAEGPGR